MKNNEQKVMLTGVRPSGNLTLGNYLGAIRNFVTRQSQYKIISLWRICMR